MQVALNQTQFCDWESGIDFAVLCWFAKGLTISGLEKKAF